MNNQKSKAYIFDLDGTVVNPGTAIPRCINYALKQQGEKTVPIERLKRYIGYSLEEIFITVTGRKDKRFVKKCIDSYRERFHKEGIAEHRLYPGIVGLLDAVSKEAKLYVASNKPTASCEMVLDHLGIRGLFTKIYGSALKKPLLKQEVLQQVIKDEKIMEPVFIGDRASDIDAAKKCQCTSIGVSYGYGTREELRNAGADRLAETVGELRQCLLTNP
ncbi:MAG: phosphoglycolate phosphatase [Deltaproteobacteria bacterium CG_4_10_14_0_2_um_filter_43_8]|nr:MAG: phosphoglycolate phosphatase [Deltaproteobacteria bacterium CG11_big_fil_rev_8_21_14_0_20_42_23]PJA21872.1 MAG: phosphoglycolate phosphatase [Deltaproteobacteria bacterium CG_4_10_14_0_2_um_filter_43_8]PJC64364.1 MAG: phosphoglycolate phosphatase [Deltaproteobacteria bacterium CG_4_9_14_0_2_um_filter_42_21]